MLLSSSAECAAEKAVRGAGGDCGTYLGSLQVKLSYGKAMAVAFLFC